MLTYTGKNIINAEMMSETLTKQPLPLFLFFLSLSGVVLVCFTAFGFGAYFFYQKDQQRIQVLETKLMHIQRAEQALSDQTKEAMRTAQTLSQAQTEREQYIQEEIETVKGLIKQNTVSAAQNALWQQIQDLNPYFKQLQFKSLGDAKAGTPAFEPKQSWEKAWEELKSIIRVTKEKENRIPAILAYQEKAELLRALQGWSQQAQWAILHKDLSIYLSSVQNLESLVQDYFMEDATQAALLGRLRQLEAVRAFT